MLFKFTKASEKEMWSSVEIHNIHSENGEFKLNRQSDLLKSAFGSVEFSTEYKSTAHMCRRNTTVNPAG